MNTNKVHTGLIRQTAISGAHIWVHEACTSSHWKKLPQYSAADVLVISHRAAAYNFWVFFAAAFKYEGISGSGTSCAIGRV